MTSDKELMQMAVDAWELGNALAMQKAIEALRARLARPEQPNAPQEPVAWWDDRGDFVDLNVSGHGTPLYTAPPQREWQWLTDEEVGILTVFDGLHHVEVPLLADFARAIEAKLKEKNGF